MKREDPRRKQLVSSMFRMRGSEFSRCFAPGLLCEEPAIRAHSVQNATALELLAHEGHVIAPIIRIHPDRPPDVHLKPVGRNQATTFTGLCSKHDQEIFSPIELEALDLTRPDHRFLLAYRATFYEVHATAAAAVLLQSGYLERTRLGLDSKDEPSPAGLAAVQRMIVAAETWWYKARFDAAYIDRRWDAIEHDLIELTVVKPTVAASALLSLDDVQRHDDIVRVCITVVPTTTTSTIVLLSYLSEDAGRARFALDRVLASSGYLLKYELSRRLINHCQNFVIAPSFVAEWSAERKKTVEGLFRRTVGRSELAFDDPGLMLFT